MRRVPAPAPREPGWTAVKFHRDLPHGARFQTEQVSLGASKIRLRSSQFAAGVDEAVSGRGIDEHRCHSRAEYREQGGVEFDRYRVEK